MLMQMGVNLTDSEDVRVEYKSAAGAVLVEILAGAEGNIPKSVSLSSVADSSKQVVVDFTVEVLLVLEPSSLPRSVQGFNFQYEFLCECVSL